MKRSIELLIIALAALCAASCADSFKDIKITSGKLVSISPRGLSAFDAVMELEVDNPAPQVTLSEMTALVKMNQEPCLHLTAEDVTISPKSRELYTVVFHGYLDENFNPFRLLELLGKANMESLTMDIRFRGSLKSGLGKHFEYKDIPVNDLMNNI